MCVLSSDVQKKVLNYLPLFLKDRRDPFTGHEFYKEFATTANHAVPSSEISAYMRELYNNRDELFEKWSSTPVHCHNGPLLYFRTPVRVERVKAKIKKNVLALQKKQTEEVFNKTYGKR